MKRIAESEVVREQASDRGRRDLWSACSDHWSLHCCKICPPRTADRAFPPKRCLQPATTWDALTPRLRADSHAHTKIHGRGVWYTQKCTKRATQQRKPTHGVERGSIGFQSPPWGEWSCPCTNAAERLSRVILLSASYDLSEMCEIEAALGASPHVALCRACGGDCI